MFKHRGGFIFMFVLLKEKYAARDNRSGRGGYQ